MILEPPAFRETSFYVYFKTLLYFIKGGFFCQCWMHWGQLFGGVTVALPGDASARIVGPGILADDDTSGSIQ